MLQPVSLRDVRSSTSVKFPECRAHVGFLPVQPLKSEEWHQSVRFPAGVVQTKLCTRLTMVHKLMLQPYVTTPATCP